MPYLNEFPKSELILQIKGYLKSLGYEDVEDGFRYSEPNRAPVYIDIMVYDGQHKPYIVVEVKQDLPKEITKFHPTVDQAYRYAQKLNAPYFLVTDGVNASWYKINKNHLGFEQLSTPLRHSKGGQLPFQNLQSNEITDQLYDVIDLLRGHAKTQEREVILSAFLLAKIFDENNSRSKKSIKFRVKDDETPSKTQMRVSKLFQSSIKDLHVSFDDQIINKLEPSLVQNIVQKIEYMKIAGTDFIGRYSESIGSLTRQSGYFHIPSPITKLIGQIFDFTTKKFVLDPALGTGDLLVGVANHVEQSNNKEPHLVGVDNNSSTVLLATSRLSSLSLLKNSNIFLSDFLFPGVQKKLFKLTKNGFDIVVCNPPFGSKGKLVEGEYITAILGQLKPGGEAAIILPESVLFDTRHREIREFLVKNAHVLAVISLPSNAYSSFSSIKTSIVIFRKRKSDTQQLPTLFLKIPDNLKQDNKSDVYTKILETYKYFYRTKKLSKKANTEIAPSIGSINARNGYSMNYFAYAPEYIQTIGHLKNIDAKVVSLGDVSNIRLGQFLSDNTQPGAPVISMRDLKDGWFDTVYENTSHLQPDLFNFTDISIKPGDLLMSSMLTSDLSVFMAPENIKPIIANRSILVITPDKKKILSGYLFALLGNDLVKMQIRHVSVGAAMSRAVPRLLREIQIPLISMQEQQQIADSVLRYYQFQRSAKDALRAANARLTELFGAYKEEVDNEKS